MKILGIPFKTVRIFLLLFLLFIIGMSTWLGKLRATDWNLPLWVVVYPINGDDSQRSSRYITSLEDDSFDDIALFLSEEAEHYEIALDTPVSFHLAPEVSILPPPPPREGKLLHVMLWSLKLRYWAYKVDTYEGPPPDIRLFLVYYNPDTHKALDHSMGLQKGRIGIVNVFADRWLAAKNKVVITHELLHTVGATDKYDMETNQPLFPDGYAEPDLAPLYPQPLAEIMGGRVPDSEYASHIPANLGEVIVGPKTGYEIRWIGEMP